MLHAACSLRPCSACLHARLFSGQAVCKQDGEQVLMAFCAYALSCRSPRCSTGRARRPRRSRTACRRTCTAGARSWLIARRAPVSSLSIQLLHPCQGSPQLLMVPYMYAIFDYLRLCWLACAPQLSCSAGLQAIQGEGAGPQGAGQDNRGPGERQAEGHQAQDRPGQ